MGLKGLKVCSPKMCIPIKNFCREFYCSNIALFWLGGGGEGEAGFLNDYKQFIIRVL